MGLIYLCTNIRIKHNIILSFSLCICIIYIHTSVHKYTLHTHITRITDITNIRDIDITDITDIIYVYICIYIYMILIIHIGLPVAFFPRTLSSALGGEVSNLTSKALGSKIGAGRGWLWRMFRWFEMMIFGVLVIFLWFTYNTCCLFFCLMTYI